VASYAGVSTRWLYAQSDVKERITRLRGQSVRKLGAPAERASDASKDAMMRALRQQVELLDDQRKQLLARVKQLEERIEVLYGELYAKRTDLEHAITDPGTLRPT
jgi:predicted  nucleic acid-binding Zn-ribbon protein